MWHELEVLAGENQWAWAVAIQKSMTTLSLAKPGIQMAIFSKQDPSSGSTFYYFSPGAEPAAIAFNAKQCPKPSRQPEDGWSLIYGDPTAFDSFFK